MNQDLIFGSDWYDPEDLDGSGEVQGEDAREDGVADALQLTSRTPEASNTRGEDAGLGELHGNLILTNDNTTPDGQQLSLDSKGRRKRHPKKVNPYTSIIQTLRRF